jgi:hypothetical protein
MRHHIYTYARAHTHTHTHTLRIQNERKMHGQTYIRWIYSTVQENKTNEHRPSEAWLLSYVLLTVKKMFKVSILSFNAGLCTSKHWFASSLENSMCHLNHLKSILYSLLPVLYVTDVYSINSRPRDKKLSDLNQGKERTMLLVHLVLSIVPERRSRIPELQDDNVVEHHHAWTINEF